MAAESAQQDEKKDKKWLTALLLSILIGSLGVDRFYMGHVGLGILKLITFGGFGIWWLIDLILIATKHNFGKVNWVE
jgi:TM2 domain-containing membrane protein YozV